MTDTLIEKDKTLDLDGYKLLLEKQGWAILPPEFVKDDPERALSGFGQTLLQFNGKKTFEVQYRPGFDNLPYSQSKNGIGPHTEAPVYDPPPRFLALHCHVQAKCGGGQTQLADGFEFYNSLDEELKKIACEKSISFSATAQPGYSGKLEHSTCIISNIEKKPIFRFSYNQFYYGDVNPSDCTTTVTPKTDDDACLMRIAELGETFFNNNLISILIPEKSILIWDNQRLMHARVHYTDTSRHLTRYWLSDSSNKSLEAN
ncbi:TauD/TfdA family dioxygenase [Acinetobacter baumannii]|nr:TauD/TfdA family dioxygenase [Acinetobacter baumannii]